MTITEVLSEISMTHTIEKKPITNYEVLNEAYDYAKPSSFSRGLRLDLGNHRNLADLRHGQHRRERPHGACRRFSRADPPHVPQHHETARSRGRDVEGHRPHHLLPAGHRPGLRGVQRRAHGVLHRAGIRSAAGIDRDSGEAVPPGPAGRNRSDRWSSGRSSVMRWLLGVFAALGDRLGAGPRGHLFVRGESARAAEEP